MDHLPEILFAGSNAAESRRLSKLRQKGIIAKLVPRVYTSNLIDSPANIILRNWQMILSYLYPGAIISHRSALEFMPTKHRNIYITHNSRKVIKWPGLTIRMIFGPDPLDDDNPIYGNLYVSSFERACLENLTPSRVSDGEKRTLPQEKIEERLLQYLTTRGEDGLNQVRDRAREIATMLSMESSFEKLNLIISSILSTKSSSILKSSQARAMSYGEPYDSSRMTLFSILAAFLKQCSFEQRSEKNIDYQSFLNQAFIDSYFSNYIEGTKFVIEDAEEIIFQDKIIENRVGDSHDIKGTYQICGSEREMGIIPFSEDELINLLRARHATILKGRPDKNPGVFKHKPNRAGETFFVQPNMVIGTLKQGFRLMSSISDPLARAMYIMFLISEVHPFNDGNGRIARIMMNAELVSRKYTKLIIPTVYRDDYLLNLRKLTRQQQPDGYVKMMDRAHSFTSWLNSKDLNKVKLQLLASNAMKDSDEGALQFPVASKSIFPNY